MVIVMLELDEQEARPFVTVHTAAPVLPGVTVTVTEVPDEEAIVALPVTLQAPVPTDGVVAVIVKFVN